MKSRNPLWTPERLEQLRTRVAAGESNRQIAEALGLRPQQVAWGRETHRVRPPMGASEVARRLGLANDSVRLWCKHGWLPARPVGVGVRRRWLVQEAGLRAFLRDQRYWHLWTVEALQDPALRHWVQQVRRADAYLTAAEVARRCHVHPHRVYQWIKAGRLPAERVGWNWLIPRAALRQGVPDRRTRQIA